MSKQFNVWIFFVKLKKLTLTIRTFFVNLRQMGKNVKTNSQTLRSLKETLVSRDVDHVNVIMNSIKDATVKAYSLNIYIIEVAKFYREIMQGGLLRKIRGLDFVKMSEEEVENLQKFILAEGKATQRLIRQKVRSVKFHLYLFLDANASLYLVLSLCLSV